jgi:DNA-binding NtrC family response regulator
MPTILVVDDHLGMRRSLAIMLQAAGHVAVEASDGVAALELVRKQPFDLVITDLRMPGLGGIDLLRSLRKEKVQIPVLVITAFGSIASAVEAMRIGAIDYITKPFQEDDLLQRVNGAMLTQQQMLKHSDPAEEMVSPIVPGLVYTSPEMKAALIKIERIARSDISVLIGGETGTGKTQLSKLIHKKSARHAGPFLSVNCANLSETLLESELFGHIKGSFTGASETRLGLLETANRGTVLLDEIDTLSLAMQAKLLQVLNDGEVRAIGSNKTKPIDIRVICASNRDIHKLVRAGEFRADLYFRICGVSLTIPPLRERPEEIEPLLDLFFARYAKKYDKKGLRLSPAAKEIVMGYRYPGNIRQLENFAEQMALFSDDDGEIDIAALPEELLYPKAANEAEDADLQGSRLMSRSDEEKSALEAALRRHPRLEDAARALGISRTTLWRKMRQYDLNLRQRK